LSSLPGKVPDLVRQRLEDMEIEIDELSLVGLQEQIVIALQNECMRRKTTKSLKKHLGFDSAGCEVFTETSSFGCSHNKTSKKVHSKSCHYSTKQRTFKPKHPRRFSMPKRKIFFKKRHPNARPKKSSCFICKNPGHWASQCPLRSKTKA